MSTFIKPITRVIDLKKPFDVRSVFSKAKKKPDRVTIVMIPSYESTSIQDDDPDRVIQTPKNKKAYKEAMIAYKNGDVITMPHTISSFEEFRSFVRANA